MDTFTIKGMAEPFEIKGVKVSERVHGYNLASGAWALYPDKDGSSTPAKFITIRPYRCSRPIEVNEKRITCISLEQKG
jgi:hypothetical protein